MRILAIGDFNGKFSEKIKQTNPDLVLCTGDISSGRLKVMEWKHWKARIAGRNITTTLDKKQVQEMIRKELDETKGILEFLDSFGVPVFFVIGNNDITDKDVQESNMRTDGIELLIRKTKNVKLMKCRMRKFKNLTVLGHSGYRGYRVKKEISDYATERTNKRWKKELDKLAKNVNEKTIFLTHDVPFGIMDKVKNKKSPAYGEHVGDEFYLEFDKKHKPMLHVCGHMEEYQGAKKVGKTSVVNHGPFGEGKYALIEIRNKNVDVKLLSL